MPTLTAAGDYPTWPTMSMGGAVGASLGSLSSITTANNTIGSPWTTYTIPYQGVSNPYQGIGSSTSTTFTFPQIDWGSLLADRVLKAELLRQLRRAFKTAWTCPRCQAVYAPTHPHCERCTIMARLEGQ